MLITEVEGEEESVPRVSLEDSTVGGGFHEDPTNQDLIQIPTRRRSRLRVCGGQGGERKPWSPLHVLRPQQPISGLRFHFELKRPLPTPHPG